MTSRMAKKPIPVSSLPPAQRRLALSLMLGPTVMRGADLAATLGVTQRTLYRDIERLRAAGFALEGDRGIGYRLPGAPHTASLVLTRDERRALIAGARLVKAGGDADLSKAAASLLKKAQST